MLGLIKANDIQTEIQCAKNLPAILWIHGYNQHLLRSITNSSNINNSITNNIHNHQRYRLPLSRRHPMLWNHDREQKVLVTEDFLCINHNATNSKVLEGNVVIAIV